MDAATIIERAADIMQTHGKSDDVYIDMRGRVCVYGALNLACGEAPNAINTPYDITRHLMAMTGWHIAYWSDQNNETTVIAGLRAVAATLRAQAPVRETEVA